MIDTIAGVESVATIALSVTELVLAIGPYTDDSDDTPNPEGYNY
jgi:hypothetical protein